MPAGMSIPETVMRCCWSSTDLQVVQITVVLRIEHLIGCRQSGLLDDTQMHLADRDDTCKQIGLLAGIRLMQKSFISFSGSPGFVRIDTGYDHDSVGDLLLDSGQPFHIFHHGFFIVRTARPDDQKESV